MKHGYQESSLSKSMRGASEAGPVMSPLVVIDEHPVTLEKSERTVRCDRGELRVKLLDAIAKGSPIVKAGDAILADTGRVRLAVWEALGMEGADGEPMVKSQPEKVDLKAAAEELDALVSRMENGR